VTQPVRLLQSILVEVPVVVGWLRPVILAPAVVLTGLAPDTVEAVLAHELAHIRRYDYLVNLGQTVVETLLFFHPAVWWVSRRIRVEREHCCDDVAVATCGSKVAYARALTVLEEGRRSPEWAMAATGGKTVSTTLSRVRHILGISSPDRVRGSVWLGGIITLALLASLAVVMPLGHVQGEAQPESPAPKAASADQPATASAGKPSDARGSEAVEGVSVRLRADRTRWSIRDTPTFTLDFRNNGTRDLLVTQAPETGKIKVDGIWHEWTLGWIGGARSPFPPGRTYEGLVVSLSDGWRVKLAPGKHTIFFATTFVEAHVRQIRSPGKPPVNPVITVTSNPVEIEIIDTDEKAAPVSVRWGTPVDGVAASLKADHFAWTADEQPTTFKASVHNLGQRDLSFGGSQALGELEVDGIEYFWFGAIAMPVAPLPPGKQYDDILVTFASEWHTKDGKPFQQSCGRHIVRFSASIDLADPATKRAPFRAVSNPVEINVEPGIDRRAALVKKYLPGCALKAVRKQTAAQELLDEILTTPSGQEVDLASLRQAWVGTSEVPSERPVAWHNPKLTELLPPLKVEIATASDAVEVARVILGVFKSRGDFEDWGFKAEHRENGWLVTPSYIGPPAQVRHQSSIELIMADGVLQDVRQIDESFNKRVAQDAVNPANATASPWHLLGQTDLARFKVEKALYEKAGEPFCFVRVRVTNVSDRAIGVDLRGWMAVYPGYFGKSDTEHNNFFKQVRMYHAALDQPKRAELLADFAAGRLTVIPAGKSVDYYREYIERAKVEKVDKAAGKYLIISMDGEQILTDGKKVEQFLGAGQEGANTDLAILSPVPWKTIPAGGRILRR